MSHTHMALALGVGRSSHRRFPAQWPYAVLGEDRRPAGNAEVSVGSAEQFLAYAETLAEMLQRYAHPSEERGPLWKQRNKLADSFRRLLRWNGGDHPSQTPVIVVICDRTTSMSTSLRHNLPHLDRRAAPVRVAEVDGPEVKGDRLGQELVSLIDPRFGCDLRGSWAHPDAGQSNAKLLRVRRNQLAVERGVSKPRLNRIDVCVGAGSMADDGEPLSRGLIPCIDLAQEKETGLGNVAHISVTCVVGEPGGVAQAKTFGWSLLAGSAEPAQAILRVQELDGWLSHQAAAVRARVDLAAGRSQN